MIERKCKCSGRWNHPGMKTNQNAGAAQFCKKTKALKGNQIFLFPGPVKMAIYVTPKV